ncbi:MAG TPA: VCBS repeat-containing protein, partial [Caldilineaceae bacterium]|nr:VCBS repeat-containing protein [Caldilineaceae bacterium]
MGKSKFYILLPGFAVVTFLFWLYSSELMAADDSSATLQNGIDLVNDLAGATSVQSADLDLDGDLDVVSAGRESGLVLWHVNDGGVLPQFARQEVGVVQGAYMVLPADLDRDGDADLVVAGVG